MKLPLFVRRAINKIIARKSYEGWGGCLRCNISWGAGVPHHATNYTEASGCFPLCAYCWSALTPAQRLPYYIKLVDRWRQDSLPGTELNGVPYDVVERQIRQAVLAGK
jgi:hypothetical protein